jgi:uncharacterized protein (TIGR02596 family)
MTPQPKKRGFTLVELLVVMAIIGLLAVVSLPAISSLTTSFNLNGASNALVGVLALGRQDAIALNAQVEVRFYQYVITGFADEPASGSFHAYQLFEDVPTTGAVKPLTRMQFLPGRIVFSPNVTLSALLTAGTTQVTGTTPAPIGLPTAYTYQIFHFRPDGSTDINPTINNFLTLADIVGLTKAGAGVAPKNYATIVIDPIAGTAKAVRP